jgi:hypothetical protein
MAGELTLVLSFKVLCFHPEVYFAIASSSTLLSALEQVMAGS